MSRCCFLVALAGLACDETRVALTWPEAIDVGFLVVVPEGWSGAPGDLEIEGPAPLESTPRVQLQAPPDARVFVVGLEEEPARSAHPRVTDLGAWSMTTRSPELAAEPRCEGEGWVHGDRVLEVPLTEPALGASTYELNPSSSKLEVIPEVPFASAVSFRASLRPCLQGQRLVAEPFADGTDGSGPEDRYFQVRFVDDEVIVLLGYGVVTAMQRGDRFEERRRIQPSAFGLPPPSPSSSWTFSAFALSGTSSAASGVVALSRRGTEPDRFFEARVFAVQLTSTGFVPGPELWRDIAPPEGSRRSVRRLAIDPPQSWVGVGFGVLLSGAGFEGAPRVYDRPINFDANFLLTTGSAEAPFILGGGSFIQSFNPALGETGLQDLAFEPPPGGSDSIDGLSVSVGPAGVGLQVAFSAPELGRRSAETGRWSYRRMWSDEGEARCMQRRYCGRPEASQRVEFVSDGPIRPGSTMVVAPASCARVYLVDEGESCAISVPFELGPPLGPDGVDPATLYDADRRGNALVLAGGTHVLELHVE